MKSRFKWVTAIIAVLVSLIIGFNFNNQQTLAAKKRSQRIKNWDGSQLSAIQLDSNQ